MGSLIDLYKEMIGAPAWLIAPGSLMDRQIWNDGRHCRIGRYRLKTSPFPFKDAPLYPAPYIDHPYANRQVPTITTGGTRGPDYLKRGPVS